MMKANKKVAIKTKRTRWDIEETKTSPETLTAAVEVATVTMSLLKGRVLYYNQFPDKMFHFSNSIIKSTKNMRI